MELKAFLDRNQQEYLDKLTDLLSPQSLLKTAKLLDPSDEDDNKIAERNPAITHKATIYFSGLAGLTLFGRDERTQQQNKCAAAFHELLETSVKTLNDSHVAVQIKLMFAYPFSNFMYDLLYLETYDHRYLSTECIKRNEKYKYSFGAEQKLTIEAICSSNSYGHLRRTLRFIQNAVRSDNKYWNMPPDKDFRGSPNFMVVKFCPISVLCCMLRINNVIFLDPYIYSKQNENAREMALLTPITYIELPVIGNEKGTKEEDYIDTQFCSFLSHFKYLWEHHLTLYASDATNYRKNHGGLEEIKKPQLISYETKGNRIERKIRAFNTTDKNRDIKAKSDNWKQYCKSELLLNCSKVLVEAKDEVENREICPLNIFIAGSWVDGSPNKYMLWYKAWIEKNLSKKNPSGLQLNPIIVDVGDGEAFLPRLYENLNISQLGLIFQTSDGILQNNGHVSRPNVYLEKGYLMGKLRKRYKRLSREECEAVFVFKERSVDIESDNLGIGRTEFDNEEHCKSQLFRFIYWIWQVTTLNSEHTIFLMEKAKAGLNQKDSNNYEAYARLIKSDIRNNKNSIPEII